MGDDNLTNGNLNVFSISPDRSFVDALAIGVMLMINNDMLALSNHLILLPTRRSCRALRDAFLRLGNGKAMLLPQIRPLGDVEEDDLILSADEISGGMTDNSFIGAGSIDPLGFKPAISPLRRQLLLTSLIMNMPQNIDKPTPDQAANLAYELAKLLDQVESEQLSLDNLEGLVVSKYAEHWQKTINFLDIIRIHWPCILEAEGAVDAGARRNQLLTAQALSWQLSPPKFNVIAAGSTGSIPATAALLHVIAKMPKGCVILPGLDQYLSDDDWQYVEKDESHPQYGMAKLINTMGMVRAEITEWQDISTDASQNIKNINRVNLISEIMRPAITSDKWRDLPKFDQSAISGIKLLECPTSAVEAGAIALMMRQSLENTGKTVALITPDRILARRVASELRRWDVDVDDSAGLPLGITIGGNFLRLVADAVMLDLSPISLLSMLKHPLTRLGQNFKTHHKSISLLERAILRGPKPNGGIAGLNAALLLNKTASSENIAMVENLENAMQNMLSIMEKDKIDFIDILKSHIKAAEILANSHDKSGIDRLWGSEFGEELSIFFAELFDAGQHLKDINPREYSALLETLLLTQTVRPKFGKHPRLFIWGPLEARLQHADLIILGSLNEGSWPMKVNSDPWMSRPMRKEFGLPLNERRIGLSAHDFCQALAAKNIVITRSDKASGAPTVKSRWLSRLDVVLEKIGLIGQLRKDKIPLQWWSKLGYSPLMPINAPEPRPPVSKRPRRLSVTAIETWMRDPYSIYARYILKLSPFEAINADPGAADRGNFIHKILEKFIAKFPTGKLPKNAIDILLQLGSDVFAPAISNPAVAAFWWPRFQHMAKWFIAEENKRRDGNDNNIISSNTEIMAKYKINTKNSNFILTAKADRIDKISDDNYAIIDYKTGSVPLKKDILSGYSPQLSLEAMMVMAGAFEHLTKGDVSQLSYWKLSGGEPAGEIISYNKDINDLADGALDKLIDLIDAFDDQNTPYRPVPIAKYAPKFNDYKHLSRILEWSMDRGDGQ